MNRKTILRHILPVCAILTVPLVIGLVIGPWLTITGLLFALPAMGFAVWGAVHIEGMREYDEHAAHFEQVLDLLKGYPNDWVSDANSDGVRHDLHDNVIVLERYRWSEGARTTSDVHVRLYDPADRKVFSDFTPNREYRDMLLKACADLQTYREMKRFVGVAVEAEKLKSPLDSALQALEDFRDRKGLEKASD